MYHYPSYEYIQQHSHAAAFLRYILKKAECLPIRHILSTWAKTDTYALFRQGNMKYEKVPADGSKKFDDDTMDSVEQFDY